MQRFVILSFMAIIAFANNTFDLLMQKVNLDQCQCDLSAPFKKINKKKNKQKFTFSNGEELTLHFDKGGKLKTSSKNGKHLVKYVLNSDVDKKVDYTFSKPVIHVKTCIYDLDNSKRKGQEFVSFRAFNGKKEYFPDDSEFKIGKDIARVGGGNKFTGKKKSIGFKTAMKQAVCIHFKGPITEIQVICSETYKKGKRVFGFDNPLFSFVGDTDCPKCKAKEPKKPVKPKFVVPDNFCACDLSIDLDKLTGIKNKYSFDIGLQQTAVFKFGPNDKNPKIEKLVQDKLELVKYTVDDKNNDVILSFSQKMYNVKWCTYDQNAKKNVKIIAKNGKKEYNISKSEIIHGFSKIQEENSGNENQKDKLQLKREQTLCTHIKGPITQVSMEFTEKGSVYLSKPAFSFKEDDCLNKACDKQGCAILFDKCNYKGRSLKICKNAQYPYLSHYMWHANQVKSIYINEKLDDTVDLYSDAGFQGIHKQFKVSQSCLKKDIFASKFIQVSLQKQTIKLLNKAKDQQVLQA